MTPGNLKNEVMAPKIWYVIDIELTFQICEFGKAWPDSYPGILTPGDLQNKVSIPKSW